MHRSCASSLCRAARRPQHRFNLCLKKLWRSPGSVARHARPGRWYAVFVWLCWPACFSKPPGCCRRSSLMILIPRWHSLVWLYLMLNATRWPRQMPRVNGSVAERATLLRCFSTLFFFYSGLALAWSWSCRAQADDVHGVKEEFVQNEL